MSAILAALGYAGQHRGMTGFRDIFRMTVRGRKQTFVSDPTKRIDNPYMYILSHNSWLAQAVICISRNRCFRVVKRSIGKDVGRFDSIASRRFSPIQSDIRLPKRILQLIHTMKRW